jgi:thiol-disulfide isomerase/thioredoxin
MRPLAPALAAVLSACAAAPSPAGTVPPPTPMPTASEAPAPDAGSQAPSPTDGSIAADPLLALELVDVRTGVTFTLADLAADQPVLVETMAIWCTTCLSQQREVVRAHEIHEFASVGIDVDPNEEATDLAAYADREGFDWHFVVADRELVRLLTERFGFEVTNPPSAPTFVVSSGSIRALDFGRIRSAEELIDELSAG